MCALHLRRTLAAVARVPVAGRTHVVRLAAYACIDARARNQHHRRQGIAGDRRAQLKGVVHPALALDNGIHKPHAARQRPGLRVQLGSSPSLPPCPNWVCAATVYPLCEAPAAAHPDFERHPRRPSRPGCLPFPSPATGGTGEPTGRRRSSWYPRLYRARATIRSRVFIVGSRSCPAQPFRYQQVSLPATASRRSPDRLRTRRRAFRPHPSRSRVPPRG